MSNLGMYEYLTTTAKAVGGPKIFMDMLVDKGVRIGIRTQRPYIIGASIVGVAVGGLIAHYAPELGKLKADKIIEQDEELKQIKSDFKRIINVEADIECARKILEENDVDEMDDENPLENLRARLEALEGDIEDDRHHLELEEEDPKESRFEDELFSFLAEVELNDQDDVFVRLAKNHPAYKSFARVYWESEPEADDLQVVKAFARAMAPHSGEEDHDEV